MQLSDSIWLFHAILATGLALWLTLATLNNLRAFHGAVWAIGNTMRMDPLRQDPSIETPLLRRALTSLALHRLSLGAVLALQLAAAIAAWTGVALFFGASLMDALPWLNLALCAMAAFLLLMHLGGLWFGYWIAQEGLQTTHLVLLLWTIGLFLLFNAQRT
jgi:predicted small integral membrane protein